MSEEVLAIDFDSEIERFKPSLEVEDIRSARISSNQRLIQGLSVI